MGINKDTIKRVGEIFIKRAVDMVLVAIYFNLEAPGLSRTKNRYQISKRVYDDLEKFDYQSIKRACGYLKQKGLISILKDANNLPKITKSGEEKLRRIISFYNKKRIWDRRIYFVSYDIPVMKTKERNYLREYLRKIGCGMLQQSIWITPYNPTLLIKKFVEDHNLSSELILVSSIGENGTVGEMTLSDLMEKVYHLNSLNFKYQEFIMGVKRNNLSKIQLIFWFLSILKEDPQIPFPLLSNDWKGDIAYNLFNKLK